MIILPLEFVKTKYPGYVWNTKDQTLWSFKVGGVLRPLKVRKIIWHRRAGAIAWQEEVPNYQISVNGRRKTLRVSWLMKTYQKDSDKLLEIVDKESKKTY